MSDELSLLVPNAFVDVRGELGFIFLAFYSPEVRVPVIRRIRSPTHVEHQAIRASRRIVLDDVCGPPVHKKCLVVHTIRQCSIWQGVPISPPNEWSWVDKGPSAVMHSCVVGIERVSNEFGLLFGDYSCVRGVQECRQGGRRRGWSGTVPQGSHVEGRYFCGEEGL